MMYASEVFERIKKNMKKVISGKDEVIDKVLICLLCEGHVLIEDMPGTGKTTVAKSLASSVGVDFKRIQFTPDLLPSELTGLKYFNQKQGDFVFSKGMVFTNILLADEINRATPRTQSSLLECMEERQVSDHGVTYQLDRPFMVIATENPIETQGTFPLPEAQLDRFFMKISMGYPSFENEVSMLISRKKTDPLSELKPVVNGDEIKAAQDEINDIYIDTDLVSYIVSIVNATRSSGEVKTGVSPRGALALLKASRCYAAVNGRNFVVPDDIKAVAQDVLSHRIIVNKLTSDRTGTAREIIRKAVLSVPVPAEKE